MTIPLLQDLVQSMDDAVTGESRQKTNFRFAHSATVVPLHAVFVDFLFFFFFVFHFHFHWFFYRNTNIKLINKRVFIMMDKI